MSHFYAVEGKSRYQLRIFAKQIRRKFKLNSCPFVPVVQLLDIIALQDNRFRYEIIPDEELAKNVHAEMDIANCVMKIRASVYDGACRNNGRDRMTIAHELAHYFSFCVAGFSLRRTFGKVSVPTYMDPEWQAKCLAAELLMNDELIKSWNPEKIASICGVTISAARYQYDSIHCK